MASVTVMALNMLNGLWSSPGRERITELCTAHEMEDDRNSELF